MSMIDDLEQRIRGLNDAAFYAFVNPADGMFYGGTPESLSSIIQSAIDAFVAGNFERTEQICAAADIEIANEKRKFLLSLSADGFTPEMHARWSANGADLRREERQIDMR